MAINGPDPYVMEAVKRGNIVVFFDVAMGESPNESGGLGRIKLELFVKDVSNSENLLLSDSFSNEELISSFQKYSSVQKHVRIFANSVQGSTMTLVI